MAAAAPIPSLYAAPAAQTVPIGFTEAFPGVKFDRPVYFGAFPGRPKTYVVLEDHSACALIVYPKEGGGWAAPPRFAGRAPVPGIGLRLSGFVIL